MSNSSSGQYEVEAIVKHQKIKGQQNKYQLHVKWAGIDENGAPWADTWEPLQNLMNDVPDIVTEYFKKKGMQVRFFKHQEILEPLVEKFVPKKRTKKILKKLS